MPNTIQHPFSDQKPKLTGDFLLDDETKSFHVWQPASVLAVLGRSQFPEKELHLDQLTKDGVGYCKRAGGGGTVLLSPETFCVCLKLPLTPKNEIKSGLKNGNRIIQNFIQDQLDISLKNQGISDLVHGDKKITGSSLRVTKQYAYYSAVICVKDISPMVSKYLKYPTREPDYRHGRNHREFIGCLEKITLKSIDVQGMVADFSHYLEINEVKSLYYP